MKKTILITGSTDGIGLETAKMLVPMGHHVLLHGRNQEKLEHIERSLSTLTEHGSIESYLADLSRMAEVETLAKAVADKHDKLDVLINNAGVYNAPNSITSDGLDIRFAVNTIAPYLLTKRLLPMMGSSGRVINLSSAAQSPVDKEALIGRRRVSDRAAYAQSKLAIIMWSSHMARLLNNEGPIITAINPGSLLATKMVKQAFGIIGADVRTGAHILVRASQADEFATASGEYFDNDSGMFAHPHQEAMDPQKNEEIVRIIDTILANLTHQDERVWPF